MSWRVNGWSFWPVDGAPRPAEVPASLEFGKVFQVSSPSGRQSPCFVGVTAHIREQAGREAGDEYWEEVCAQSLLNLLWEKAEAPPAVLPLYDAGNFGMQRRRVHGVMADSSFDPRAIMNDQAIEFTKAMEGIGTIPGPTS